MVDSMRLADIEEFKKHLREDLERSNATIN